MCNVLILHENESNRSTHTHACMSHAVYKSTRISQGLLGAIADHALWSLIDRQASAWPRIWIINECAAVRRRKPVAAKLCPDHPDALLDRTQRGLICRVGAHQRLFIKATHVASADSHRDFIYAQVGDTGARPDGEQRLELIGKGIFSLWLQFAPAACLESPGNAACYMLHATRSMRMLPRALTVALVPQSPSHTKCKIDFYTQRLNRWFINM